MGFVDWLVHSLLNKEKITLFDDAILAQLIFGILLMKSILL